jgi:hypothetical protein
MRHKVSDRIREYGRRVWGAVRVLIEIAVLVGVPLLALLAPERLCDGTGARVTGMIMVFFMTDAAAGLRDDRRERATVVVTRRSR